MLVARQMIPNTIKFIKSAAAPKQNDRAELFGMRSIDNTDKVAKRHICVAVGRPFGDLIYTKPNENDNTILISANMVFLFLFQNKKEVFTSSGDANSLQSFRHTQ